MGNKVEVAGHMMENFAPLLNTDKVPENWRTANVVLLFHKKGQ